VKEMTVTNSLLRDFNEKYKFLINNIKDVILETELDGISTYVSPQVYELFGYRPEELLGVNFLQFIHDDDKPTITKILSQIVNSEEGFSLEYKVKHKAGHFIPVSAHGSLVKSGDNLKLVGILRDISDKKNFNQKLEESEKKFKLLYENAPLPYQSLDENGNILEINKAWLKFFGYSKDDVIGRWLGDFMVPSSSEFFKARFPLFKEHGEVRDVKYEIVRSDGTNKTISFNGKVSYNEFGNFERTHCIFIDITEKKNMERKLKTSEEKYHAIFEQAMDSIILIDTDTGEIVDFNEQMHKTLGYTRAEFEKLRIPEFDLMEDEEDYKRHLKKVISEGSDSFETKYRTKNGDIKDILINVKAIKIMDKTFLHSILQDVTEQRKFRKQIVEINSLKSELLERTSHELKTPLISIKGFTDLLLELHRDKFDDEAYSILGEIKHGTERLETIINKLLEASQLESGQMQIKPTREDLSFLIKFCVRNLRGLAATRNHFINLNLHNKIILNFEKEKIHEVVSHLIINALKFTPPYGEIQIQSDYRDDCVVISVKDNGIGFTKDEKKKIFKKFGKIERYGQGWNIGIEGTGMGLYTSKKIIELHGGEIWVESLGRNKGSKFSFSLPLIKE